MSDSDIKILENVKHLEPGKIYALKFTDSSLVSAEMMEEYNELAKRLGIKLFILLPGTDLVDPDQIVKKEIDDFVLDFCVEDVLIDYKKRIHLSEEEFRNLCIALRVSPDFSKFVSLRVCEVQFGPARLKEYHPLENRP